MFKSKSVDSILKAFNTAISDLGKLEMDNLNKSIDIEEQKERLEAQRVELVLEADRARTVRAKLQDLTSI